MAEDDEGESEESGGDGDAEPKKGKRMLIIIIAVVFLLFAGGIAGAYFTGLLDPVLARSVGKEEVAEGGTAPEITEGVSVIFHDLPEILVNLNTGGRKSSFLKIKVALELQSQADIARVEALMPRVKDNFVVYLRELRIEDLQGSAGVYRLREELMRRVSNAVAPVVVKDVLFREMLVQ